MDTAAKVITQDGKTKILVAQDRYPELKNPRSRHYIRDPEERDQVAADRFIGELYAQLVTGFPIPAIGPIIDFPIGD